MIFSTELLTSNAHNYCYIIPFLQAIGVPITQLVYSSSTYSLEYNIARVMLTFVFLYIVDLASLVLALLSMRVKVDVLSDGKYVMAIVYTNVIIKTLLFISLMITHRYANVKYTLTSLAILSYSLTVLFLLSFQRLAVTCA